MEAMRAEPPKGEPPTPRSAEDFRATFYSNPIFDPKLWQALGRGLVSTLGLPKAAAEQVVRLLRMTDTGAQAVNIGAQISRTARDLNAYLFRSTDARIRTLAGRAEADKLPITSRIIREIANELHALAGNAGEATKEALHEAVQSRVLRRLNHLGDMLDAVYRMPEAARRAAMTEIDRLVRNPRSIRNDGTPVHKAAAGIRALMREELEYRRAAGIDMGEVKDGYMPRVLERERAINDPKAFMRSATEAYRKMGMSRVEAADAAERWLANLHLDEYGLKGPNDFSSTGGTGKPQSTKERVLNRAAEEVMRRDGWYMQDVGQSIADYITRGTKHAEFARRFGPNLEKWNGWREQILKEGGAEYLPTLAGLVQSSAGLNQTIANHAVRSTVTGLKTLGAIVYLAHSPFSSLAEQTAGAIVRTANVADGLRNTVYTIRNLANRIPGLKNMTETQRSQQWVRLSEDLGAVSAGQELIAMSLLTSRTELPSARGITTKFLRPLSILTDAQRTATTQLGDLFFHRLAARVGDAGDTLTRQLLREHGIPDAQQAAFAKWMQTGRAGDLTIPAPGHAMGDLYRTAMGRFINGVILAPTPAMKTALANHPIGSLVTQLGSFNQAWFQQMFMRAARMAKQSVTGADLRFLDRVRLMTPMALGVPISVALGYGVQRLKEKIYASGVPPQQERTTGENILQAVSQVGLTGSADVLYNTMMPMIQGHLGIGTPGQGARYQRDPLTVMSGPVPGAINEAFSTMVNMWSDRNSPNTNNAERRLGRVAWNLGVAPVVGTGMALMRGGGGLLGQAAIQAVYHPWVREQAIRAVAGPPAPPRAQGVYHPLPPSVRPVAPR